MRTQKIAHAALAALSCGLLCFSAVSPSQAQTQAEMNRMAYRDEAKADAAMNAAYKKLMAKLDAPDKAKLKKAQRAWLAFRDADAASLASQETGGSMYPMVYSSYVQEITEARTKELKTALEGILEN